MQSRCVDRLVYRGVGFDFAQGASKEKDIQYLTRSNARDDLDLAAYRAVLSASL